MFAYNIEPFFRRCASDAELASSLNDNKTKQNKTKKKKKKKKKKTSWFHKGQNLEFSAGKSFEEYK